MRRVLDVLFKGVMLIFGGAVLGTLLLIVVYLMPVNSENRDKVYAQLETEGWYPRASIITGSHAENLSVNAPDILDNNTDKIMLYTALDTIEGNSLVRAMRSHNEYTGDYSYYWHGYVSILRPLLLFFDYSELRTLNSVFQLLLIFLLAGIIWKQKGIKHGVFLVISYVLMGNLAMPLSLQFTWVFYIAYIGAYLLLKKIDYFTEHYIYLFIILGMLSSYFDLLTYPLFTWGLPLIWWIALDDVKRRPFDWLKRVVVSGFSWIAGYAGMWFMKWFLATQILGYDVIECAINQIFLRSGMQEVEYSLFERFRPVWSNWRRYEYSIYFLIFFIVLVWWLWTTVVSGWHKNEKRYAYFLIALSSVVWYVTLAYHTDGHNFFTYRIFGISVLAFFMLVLDSVSHRKTGVKVKRLKWRFICLWAAAIFTAFLLTLITREEIYAHNGYASFRQIEMESDGSMEVSFTPTYNGIRMFKFGLECAGTKGQYKFTIFDGDAVKEQEIFQIADAEHEYYHELNVSWHLKRNKEYQLTIEIQGADAPVYIWVTEPEDMPLTEYGELEVDGVKVGGQLLTGISYWNPPASKKTFLFIVITFTAIIISGIYVFWPSEDQKKAATQNIV